ncbi:MAG: amino acid permease [Acidobacteriaceae bacterium]|nr:amino acid permease [Acidobacteriaceae bacterium]
MVKSDCDLNQPLQKSFALALGLTPHVFEYLMGFIESSLVEEVDSAAKSCVIRVHKPVDTIVVLPLMETTSIPTGTAQYRALRNDETLARKLSARQLTMIALGGAIGTGLFLGSSLAIRLAGPAVIITYVIGAVIALLLMGALSEMAVAHPTAGSFGVYAELYVSPWAGFVVRYTYWAAQTIAIGGEATAGAIFCRWWFPNIPAWIWIVGFSVALIYVNARSVAYFGEFEYWFAMTKVVAIVLFIVFGLATLVGAGSAPAVGLLNFTADGGFMPNGFKGVWLALVFVVFSYIGTEIVAVTAGEANDPEKTVPRAMKSMVGRLIVFYIAAISLLIGLIPWRQIQPGLDVTASPFVKVFQAMHIPAAAHLVNFVVLTAALSSMNCNLYLSTRMLFSLARGGYAPAQLGKVSSNGTPVNSLLLSGLGLIIATVVALLYPKSAYVYMFGIALFGGLFVWLMIFVTHLYFRRQWDQGRPLPVKMIGYPYTTILGIVLLSAILMTTLWVDGMQITLTVGLPWLATISLAYFVWKRSNRNYSDNNPT